MRPLVALLTLALSGCTTVEATSRTERGPLLRTFHRTQTLEGGVSAEARVEWPTLKLTMVGHDTCRDEAVEEYAEDTITERSTPSAGPSLSVGVIGVGAAAALFGISYAVSNTPDRSHIDQAGNYGPSTATIMRGWSLVGLGVGLPAVAVAIISAVRGGEDTTRAKSEQVASQHDVECNARPVTGPVTIQSDRGALASKPAIDGAVDFAASELKGLGEVDSVVFYGRAATLDEKARAALDGFWACVQAEPVLDLPTATEQALLRRVELLRTCRTVRADVEPALQAAEAELAHRREGGAAPPSAFSPRADVASFEEAVSAWNPRLVLRADSPDLARLEDVAALEGQAALVQGVVSDGLAQNIGVLQVGARSLFVFLPPRRSWGFDFGNGTRVEAVVVLSGTQTVGERTLPLARAIWMRPAF